LVSRGALLPRGGPDGDADVDGVGHFMFDEVPDRAATIVVDFPRDLDCSASLRPTLAAGRTRTTLT
jgi:hypothetical protein